MVMCHSVGCIALPYRLVSRCDTVPQAHGTAGTHPIAHQGARRPAPPHRTRGAPRRETGAASRGGRRLRRARLPRCLDRRGGRARSEEHTSELQSQSNLVCRLLLEKKKKRHNKMKTEVASK